MNVRKQKYHGNNSLRKAEELINEGYEVVLDFGTKTDPEKIESVLEYFNDEYGLELSIRHAELSEFVENMVIGGVSGAGVGLLYSFFFGGPAGLLALTGGLVGGLIGALSTTVHITVYKYKGHTMMKIKQLD